MGNDRRAGWVIAGAAHSQLQEGGRDVRARPAAVGGGGAGGAATFGGGAGAAAAPVAAAAPAGGASAAPAKEDKKAKKEEKGKSYFLPTGSRSPAHFRSGC